MANTLANKWDMARRASLQTSQLERLVEERTQALQLEIEERKHLESQLVQSEKLASLGQLAAGVAHEINNPVGFISSNLSTLDGYFKQLQQMLDAYQRSEAHIAEPEHRDPLTALRNELDLDFLKDDIPILIRESKDGIGRVVQIVKDLKNFSRVDNDQTWQFANLQQGIDSTLNIVASELKYKADVIKHYAPLPEIECLASQLNQVVMNLVINAAQAMGPERGTITISNGVEGEHVWLEVTDNGCGIAPTPCRRFSTRSSPPSRWAKVRGWACRCPTGSSRNTVAISASAVSWARVRSFGWYCRFGRRRRRTRRRLMLIHPLFRARSKRGKALVETGNPAFGLGLALLAGIDRVRGAGDVQRDVGIGVAVAVFMGAITVGGGTDEEEHVGGSIVEQHGAVVGVDTSFHEASGASGYG